MICSEMTEMVERSPMVEELARFMFDSRVNFNADARPQWEEADEFDKDRFYRDAAAAIEFFKSRGL